MKAENAAAVLEFLIPAVEQEAHSRGRKSSDERRGSVGCCITKRIEEASLGSRTNSVLGMTRDSIRF